MKKFRLFKVLSIFAIAAAGAVAVGVGTKAPKVEAAEAAVGSSGNVIIRKDDTDMKYSGSSLVAYLFNDTRNAWIDPVVNDGKTYQELTWSLDFTPTKIIILRVNTAAWSKSNPWNNVWSRTGNVTLTDTEVIWMRGTAGEYTSGDWGSFSCVATVKGGASDSWTTATVDKVLGKIKTDGNKIEVYDSVNFPANTYFKVVKGSDWYGNYEAHESIASNLNGGGSNNIHNIAQATYEVYFNYESPSVYITDPVKADADEWSQAFMSGGCTTATTGTKAKWGSHASSYAALVTKYGSAFSNIFVTAEHVDYKDTAVGYVAEAMQRYDYVLELYGVNDANTDALGYQDFIGRVAANKVTPNLYSRVALSLFGNNDNNGAVVSIIVISLVSISALAGLLYIRKRKHI